MSISSLKNNVMSSLVGARPTEGGKGRSKLDLAVQVMQTATQLLGSLRDIRAMFKGGAQGMPQGGAQGMPQGGAQGMPQGMPQGGAQGMPQGMPQGGAQGMPQGMTQGMPQGGMGSSPMGQFNPVQQLGSLVHALQQSMQGIQGMPGGMPHGGQGHPAMGAQGQPAGPNNTPLPLGPAVTALNNIRQEQGALLEKIAEGVSNGKITQQELAPLMKGVSLLAQATKTASADGQLTMGEANTLQQMSHNNIQATKSSYENGLQSSFASHNPIAQTQAQQLGAMSQGMKNGSISNASLAKLADGQAALATAHNQAAPGQTGQLVGVQQALDAEIQSARTRNGNG